MADIQTSLRIWEKKTQYDQYAKSLLAFKPILAYILVSSVKEFYGMDPNDVIPLIEGDISISETPLDPGFTNDKGNDSITQITGMNVESKVPHEGLRYFDILFYVRLPSGLSKVIVNIEIQKDDPAEYHIENRGIYYAARTLSSQLDRDFSNNDYDSIQKVYSIWICMNLKEDSIGWIHLFQDPLQGNPRWDNMFDILNIVIIRLKKTLDEDVSHRLHRLLGALFIPSLSIEEKEAILINECNIDISTHRKELLDDMCNLGQGLVEQGIEQGTINGIMKLLAKGLSEDRIIYLLDVTPEQLALAKAKLLKE